MIAPVLYAAFATMTSAAMGASDRPVLRIEGERVHTVTGAVIENGAVLVEDGRITAVGPSDTIPTPDHATIVRGAVVTPGLIDAWATAGLTGPRNHGPDQDHAERDAPVRPELRAIDAFHPRDPLLDWIRGYGVTVVNAGPSPGQPVSGRTLIAENRVARVSELALEPDAFVVFSLGDGPKSRFADRGTASRMGSAATIRQALMDARDYSARRALPAADRPPVDLGLEALVELLDGKRRALMHAHRADDIDTALRLADEFGIDIALAGGAEAWLMADTLAAADVPVLVGPVMARSWRDGEQRNSSFACAARLADAGVTVGFMSGYEGYVPKVRVVLWEAAVAGAHGLGAERTLAALTIDAARILGIDDRTGSIEVGKRADIAVYDGDPFEYTSHACTVVVGGSVVSDTCR
ncbi:MAG: amidohydrolase [Deltaproteobacteria bacterium]|nr:amidohydrolase [Deltaproteobacteria bacterium]HCH65328.1 amidohydrolase [Deltaproteobacteria bacterium]